jgi:hypothetical protein
MPNGVPDPEREEHLRVLEAVLNGPMNRLVGWSIFPGVTNQAVGVFIAEVSWKATAELIAELDALPPPSP